MPLLYVSTDRGLAILEIGDDGQLGRLLLDPTTHNLGIGRQVGRQFAIDPSGQCLVAPSGSPAVRSYRLHDAGMPSLASEMRVAENNYFAAITLLP